MDVDFRKDKDSTLVYLEEIKARDTFSAKMLAEEKLEMLCTVLSLFHHKEQVKWKPDCIVINERTKESSRPKKKTNPMHKCNDQRQPSAARKAHKFLFDFALEENSFNIFTRAAELHSLALSSDSKENQILNLWIALESIIPTNHDSNSSNIEHIINSIAPFINIGYYQRLVAQLTSELYNWSHPKTKNAIRKIAGKNTTVKIAKLISLPEHETEREELIAQFNDFHLMKDRFEHLSSIHSSPQKMISGLNAHKQRIAWQIRRIYRARNMIVHSGKTPSYTEILIENTHDYLDTVTGFIISLASEPRKITSIEQAFKYIDIKYKSMKNELEKKNAIFSSDLIDKLYGEL